jgi:hypothetical protein
MPDSSNARITPSVIPGRPLMYWKSTSVVTPERIDSTQPCRPATCISSGPNRTAAGSVMQLIQSFSTMSSPRPLSRVWNRCVWVLTIPGMTMRPVQSTTSAPGCNWRSRSAVPMAAMRSFSISTLARSSTSRRSFIVISQPSASK